MSTLLDVAAIAGKKQPLETELLKHGCATQCKQHSFTNKIKSVLFHSTIKNQRASIYEFILKKTCQEKCLKQVAAGPTTFIPLKSKSNMIQREKKCQSKKNVPAPRKVCGGWKLIQPKKSR